jgi:trans-aconitate 2-methyltransferase
MTWNPDRYLRFAQPRLRPALDLLARIPLTAPRSIVDLGCGTGQVTRLLAERWPDAQVTGVDDSGAMLAKASAVPSRIDWIAAGVAEWTADEPVDLVFSNAALHWLPDHERLFPRLGAAVAPGGVLAVQMPRNFAAPSHTSIAETIRSGAWQRKLEPLVRPVPVRDPAFYYALLKPFASTIDIWETEYLHALDGPDPVKEWTKGTWLKTFLDALDEPERSDFEREYAARVRRAYPPQPDGTTLFPFRRLFVVVQKA